MSTSRRRFTLTFPPMSSFMPGIVREGMPLLRQVSVIWRTSLPDADGMAITTSSTRRLARTDSRSVTLPMTRTP